MRSIARSELYTGPSWQESPVPLLTIPLLLRHAQVGPPLDVLPTGLRDSEPVVGGSLGLVSPDQHLGMDEGDGPPRCGGNVDLALPSLLMGPAILGEQADRGTCGARLPNLSVSMDEFEPSVSRL